MKTPLYWLILPPFLQLPPPLFFLLSCFFWLNKWSCHVWCAILLNGDMNLHISSLGTLVPKGDWFVFYATILLRSNAECGFLLVLWFSITHMQTHTHTHTLHSGASRLTHLYKYIFYTTCYMLTAAAFVILNDLMNNLL